MSIKMMNRAWALPADVSKGRRLVILALADQANDEGICWPGDEHLSARTGLDERTVRRAVHWLGERGYVKVSAYQGMENAYILALPEVQVKGRKKRRRRLRPDDPRHVNPGQNDRGRDVPNPGQNDRGSTRRTPDNCAGNPGHLRGEPRTFARRTPDILSSYNVIESNSKPCSESSSKPGTEVPLEKRRGVKASPPPFSRSAKAKTKMGSHSSSPRALPDVLAEMRLKGDESARLLAELGGRLGVDLAGRTVQGRSDVTCLRRAVTECELGKFGEPGPARVRLMEMADASVGARKPMAAFQSRLKVLRKKRA